MKKLKEDIRRVLIGVTGVVDIQVLEYAGILYPILLVRDGVYVPEIIDYLRQVTPVTFDFRDIRYRILYV